MIVRTFAACALTLLGATSTQAGLPRTLYSRGPMISAVQAGGVLLTLHNVERRRVGVPTLSWDPALAQGAQVYANELARLNLLRHSPKVVRPGIGENLWMGTRDYFRLGNMVGAWTSERAMFRPASFPAVSTTGNWADVGHYTQMIWRGTERVGCAIAKSASADVLVCRYWPSGNVNGQRVP